MQSGLQLRSGQEMKLAWAVEIRHTPVYSTKGVDNGIAPAVIIL